MRPTLILALLTLACIPPATADGPAGRLEIHAEPATVSATETKRERRLLTLPALEFPLRLRPRCVAGTAVEHVSVTAADTRLVFGAADFAAGDPLEAILRLPGEQLAPLGLDGECAAADSGSDAASVLVPAAFSAHASLLCAGEARREMIYATLALAVKLVCASPGEPRAAAGDQSAAAGSASF